MAAGAGGGRRRGAKRSSKYKQLPNHKKSQQENHHHHFNLDQQQQRQQNLLLNLLNDAVSAAHSFLSQNDLLLLPSQTLALESLLSSTLLSLRKTLQPLSPPPPPPPSQPPPPQQQCWFRRFLSATSSNAHDPLWWSHAFRMSEPSFTLLLRLLTPALDNAIPSVPANYVLAAALYRLAQGAAYKAVGRRFGLDSAEACRAFYTVCKAINEKLGHLFEFRSDIKRVVVGFGWISLPNCCGILGFERFGIDGEVLGKNGSVLVQALVDSEGRFLDVSAGWPSTLKPETILQQTKLYLGVEESRELLNGPHYQLSDGSSIPQYILGDSGFPLLPWLLTPYASNTNDDQPRLGSKEKAFNSVHSGAMALVGTAFGRVRTRWRLLSKQWKEECMEFLPFVVVTGCLLHNFLIKCSEPMPDDENLECLKEEDVELPVCNGEMNESGKRIRDSLANHLNRVSLRRR